MFISYVSQFNFKIVLTYSCECSSSSKTKKLGTFQQLLCACSGNVFQHYILCCLLISLHISSKQVSQHHYSESKCPRRIKLSMFLRDFSFFDVYMVRLLGVGNTRLATMQGVTRIFVGKILKHFLFYFIVTVSP